MQGTNRHNAVMATDKTSQIEVMHAPSALAKAAGISEKTVGRLLRSGRIKGVKIGGNWRISDTEVRRVLTEGVEPAPEAAA